MTESFVFRKATRGLSASCHLVTLSSCHLVILSPCHLVTHHALIKRNIANVTHRATICVQPEPPARIHRILSALRDGCRPDVLAGAFLSGYYRLLAHGGDYSQAAVRSGAAARRRPCGNGRNADDLRVLLGGDCATGDRAEHCGWASRIDT